MFTKTRGLETAFQHVRLFCVLWMLVCSGLMLYALTKSFSLWRASEQRVYVLASGKILEAVAGDRKDNLPVEARDHIRSFHLNLFTLDPDDKVINGNIGRALYLADGSAKQFYDDLKEKGVYASIISGNISQQLAVDSISLEMERYPYYFRCWGTQKIIRATSVVTRSLLTEGWLRNCSRSDNNPHGFLIERWKVLDNRDLKVEAR